MSTKIDGKDEGMGTILLLRCPECGVSRAIPERPVTRCTGGTGTGKGGPHWPTVMERVGAMEVPDTEVVGGSMEGMRPDLMILDETDGWDEEDDA